MNLYQLKVVVEYNNKNIIYSKKTNKGLGSSIRKSWRDWKCVNKQISDIIPFVFIGSNGGFLWK